MDLMEIYIHDCMDDMNHAHVCAYGMEHKLP